MKIYGKSSAEVKNLFEEGRITVAVYGLGKMGLPLANVFAGKGAFVIGVDIDENIVKNLNNGVNHIKEEPGLDELLKKNIENNKFSASANFADASKKADVIIILVPTLVKKNKVDLSIVQSVAKEIAKGLHKGTIIITENTMPPGSTEELIPIFEGSGLKCGKDFGLAHCPERTMTGTAIRDITGQYPKITGGIDKKTTDALIGLYSVINSKGVLPVSSIKSAETVKVFEGIYRDVNIAVANELSIICRKLDIDAKEVFEAANTQPYCNIHKPGYVGGHCIPYYPHFVMDEYTKLIKISRKINESTAGLMVDDAVSLLKAVGKKTEDSNILVLGLTFRSGVKAFVHTPAKPVIEKLNKLKAKVYAYDPLCTAEDAEKLGAEFTESFKGMDCVLILTDHKEFCNLDWVKIGEEMRNKVLVDGRQVADPDSLRKLGFLYKGIGRK